ncbi:MAG: hypothetical protein IIB15_03405 [Chloroflexi bacterium]|nr:hypothetical protein [Chloroflexota bacterium]
MGGSAREWSTVISSDIVPGSQVELRLVMTKFGPPGVRIAYEVRLEPQ